MTRAMSTSALLDAITRLDQAVSRAEATLDAASASMNRASESRNAAIREAIGELDGLIASLREKKDG